MALPVDEGDVDGLPHTEAVHAPTREQREYLAMCTDLLPEQAEQALTQRAGEPYAESASHPVAASQDANPNAIRQSAARLIGRWGASRANRPVATRQSATHRISLHDVAAHLTTAL
jgi:hypothetical protein